MVEESHSLQTPRPDGPSEVEHLRTLLYTDDLTGLYNRRFFRHCIEEQKSNSDATGKPFALLIMDVDHFKQINDTYGHAVGDSALICVAKALKEKLQDLGWVFRYAGDEFVALMREAGEAPARNLCGKILTHVSSALLQQPADFPLKTISMSIGIAIYPEDGNGISSLFQSADRALYASKQGGRNCFHSVRELSTHREGTALEWPIRVHCESLVGRQPQWNSLLHHFEECKAGRGRLLFVTGEAGIGKSRLLRQFTRRQRAGDYHILYGDCTESSIIHSYAPFRDALRKGFEAKDPATINLYRSLEAHNRRELIALVPQFDRFEREPLPPVQSSDRYLLLESILLLLQALSRQLPTVVVLEDIHWIDEATLNLLQYLARNIRNERILMIATFREEEAMLSQLPSIIQNMSRENLYESISLKALNSEETAIMVEELFQGYTTYLAFKQWIYEETEGIPFYIEELIKLMLEEGYIQRFGNEIEARKPEKFLLPYSIRALVQRRINRLSESLQRVLGFASIIGYEFDLQSLARLIEENEGYLLDLLEQLVRLQLIREFTEGGEERFRFRHNKIRDVIYEDMGLIKRKKVHRRVGEILESIHAEELDLYAEDLAYHFEQGGVMQKAFGYSLEAGKKALQIHAYNDAQTHFDRCFGYVDLMDASGAELLVELYQNKAATMEALGNWDEAIRCCNQVLALQRTGQPTTQQADVLNTLSHIYYMKEDLPKSEEAASNALELSFSTQYMPGICTGSYNVGKNHWRRGEYESALKHIRTAVEIAEQTHDPKLAKYLNSAGIVSLDQSDYKTARTYISKAFRIYEAGSDKPGMLECQVNLSILERHKGRLEDAKTQILEAVALSQEIGDPYRIAACAVNQAEVELELANYEQANRLNERAGRIYNELNHTLGQTHYLQNEARLHRLQANLEAAQESTFKARVLAQDGNHPRRLMELILEEGRISFYKGDWRHSMERLTHARELSIARNDLPVLRETHLKLGFLYSALGDLENAQDCWRKGMEGEPAAASTELLFWQSAAASFIAALEQRTDAMLAEQQRMRSLAEHCGATELITLSYLISAYQLQAASMLQEALQVAEAGEQCAVRYRQELHLTRLRMKQLELKRLLEIAFSSAEVVTLLEAAKTHPQEQIVFRCYQLLTELDPNNADLRDERLQHWDSWKPLIPDQYHPQ